MKRERQHTHTHPEREVGVWAGARRGSQEPTPPRTPQRPSSGWKEGAVCSGPEGSAPENRLRVRAEPWVQPLSTQERNSEELISPSGRTRPQVAGQLGPWKVLQSPLGIFHIHVLPSAVPASRIGARGCHSIHWTGRKSQQGGPSPHPT